MAVSATFTSIGSLCAENLASRVLISGTKCLSWIVLVLFDLICRLKDLCRNSHLTGTDVIGGCRRPSCVLAEPSPLLGL